MRNKTNLTFLTAVASSCSFPKIQQMNSKPTSPRFIIINTTSLPSSSSSINHQHHNIATVAALLCKFQFLPYVLNLDLFWYVGSRNHVAFCGIMWFLWNHVAFFVYLIFPSSSSSTILTSSHEFYLFLQLPKSRNWHAWKKILFRTYIRV